MNNLLVRACRLYLESELILAGFKGLANFTYFITMPYLNFVEKSDQSALVKMLPKLYEYLCEGNLDTLSDHKVEWTHVSMAANAPSTELDKLMLNKMCTHAAQGVYLQCSREYWEMDESKVRSTQLHKLAVGCCC